MIKRIIPKNEFTRNVLTLMTGTTVAQVIPLAVSPILTRIYTPEEFGLFGLFFAIVTMLSVIVTGRYELAIVQARRDRDIDNMMVLSLAVTCGVSLVTLVLALVFGTQIAVFIGSPEIEQWLYFVPLSLFLMGCFQSCNYWFNRAKRYGEIASSKVYQSSATVTVNVSTSAVATDSFGLIIGHMVGQIIAVGILLRRLFKPHPAYHRFECKGISYKRCLVLAKRYQKCPKYMAPGAILDSASLQLPVIFIARFFDTVVTGYFNFIYRIVGGPLSLISAALAQVLLQRVATADAGDIYPFVIKAVKRLTLAAIPFVLLIYFAGEFLFALVFGEAWRVAGQYATILIFSIAIRFVVSPLSMVMTLERNIKLGMLWQAMYFASVCSVLFIASSWPIEQFLLAYVVQDVVLYLIYLAFIIIASKRMKICAE